MQNCLCRSLQCKNCGNAKSNGRRRHVIIVGLHDDIEVVAKENRNDKEGESFLVFDGRGNFLTEQKTSVYSSSFGRERENP